MAHVSHHRHRQHGHRPSPAVAAGAATPSSCSARPTPAPRSTGDIVVLAVPYPAIATSLAAGGDSLAGKIVVDITNPLNFETFDSLVVPADSSAAAEIAAALPDSRVLKAFNTTFAATLASGQVGSLPTTVLIAGDDADAKSLLAGDRHRRRARRHRRRFSGPGPRARGHRLPADSPWPRTRRSPLDRWFRRRGLTPEVRAAPTATTARPSSAWTAIRAILLDFLF